MPKVKRTMEDNMIMVVKSTGDVAMTGGMTDEFTGHTATGNECMFHHRSTLLHHHLRVSASFFRRSLFDPEWLCNDVISLVELN